MLSQGELVLGVYNNPVVYDGNEVSFSIAGNVFDFQLTRFYVGLSLFFIAISFLLEDFESHCRSRFVFFIESKYFDVVLLEVDHNDIDSPVGVDVTGREVAVYTVFYFCFVAELLFQVLGQFVSGWRGYEGELFAIEEQDTLCFGTCKWCEEHFEVSCIVPLSDIELLFKSICFVGSGF